MRPGHQRRLSNLPSPLLALGKRITRLGRRFPLTGDVLQWSRNRARENLLRSMPKHSVCAEIGVWQGEFSQQILDIVAPRKLVLIDPWAYEESDAAQWHGGMQGHATSQGGMDAVYEDVAKRFGTLPNVSIIRDFSSGPVSLFSDESFDWVYIDGNHSFDYVMADLQAYLPKVKSKGFVTGDDYFWAPDEDFPVKRAVDRVVDAGIGRLVSIRRGQWILQKA